jgi:hypothetical protein
MHRAGNGLDQPGVGVRVGAGAADLSGEAAAGTELHAEVGLARGLGCLHPSLEKLAHLVNRDDARVVQTGDGLGLAAEAVDVLRGHLVTGQQGLEATTRPRAGCRRRRRCPCPRPSTRRICSRRNGGGTAPWDGRRRLSRHRAARPVRDSGRERRWYSSVAGSACQQRARRTRRRSAPAARRGRRAGSAPGSLDREVAARSRKSRSTWTSSTRSRLLKAPPSGGNPPGQRKGSARRPRALMIPSAPQDRAESACRVAHQCVRIRSSRLRACSRTRWTVRKARPSRRLISTAVKPCRLSSRTAARRRVARKSCSTVSARTATRVETAGGPGPLARVGFPHRNGRLPADIAPGGAVVLDAVGVFAG